MRAILFSIATLSLSLSLAACGQSGTPSAGGDRFAGLDGEIRTWREAVLADHRLCSGKAGDMVCQAFEVACKAERTITTAEQQNGVTAKLVAAMTFEGKGAGPTDLKPGSAFAEFSKAGETWTRTETGPVNLSTCGGA